MVSIAVVTALTVDLAYQTRVSAQLAANARDELRAQALAKSAVNVSRLVLHFQQQLDGVTSAARTAAGALGGAAGAPPGGAGAAGQAVPPPAPASPLGGGLRLWDLVPVDSSLVGLLLGGGAGPADGPGAEPGPPPPAAAPPGAEGPAEAGAAPPRRGFGDFDGAFQAKIEDEERKINVRQLAGIATLPIVQAARLAELIRDPRYDFLFDEDDANGWRVGRRELFAQLKDWADEDQQSSSFTGNLQQPFEQGYSDENAFYDRLEDRYAAKNAAFDSMGELYLVAGVSDAFMAAFGDALTVYPELNAKINVNTTDRAQILLNVLAMSNPPNVPQPAVLDPAFPEKLDVALALARPLPFLSITVQQFARVLQELGVQVNPLYLQPVDPSGQAAFSDRSTTFRIRATGTAGEVTRHVDAVVVFDRRAGPLAQDLGRLIHWHEE
jgi:general secretion pathway protein K